MSLDFFVKQRLRDGGVVDFAVAVAAVSDEVDDHIAAEILRDIPRRFGRRARRRRDPRRSRGKSGTDWRLAMSEAKREDCSCTGRVVKPIKLLTMM